jgi:alkyl hydroperoxide reductase subunit AhpC
MCKAYDVFNEANGAPRRAIIIINTKGKVVFSQEYTSIPSPDEILTKLD